VKLAGRPRAHSELLSLFDPASSMEQAALAAPDRALSLLLETVAKKIEAGKKLAAEDLLAVLAASNRELLRQISQVREEMLRQIGQVSEEIGSVREEIAQVRGNWRGCTSVSTICRRFWRTCRRPSLNASTRRISASMISRKP
jgi:hypothetical protein